jgi:hypothetical protein
VLRRETNRYLPVQSLCQIGSILISFFPHKPVGEVRKGCLCRIQQTVRPAQGHDLPTSGILQLSAALPVNAVIDGEGGPHPQ